MNYKPHICENKMNNIMTLVMNSIMNESSNQNEDRKPQQLELQQAEDLKLIKSQTISNPSPMPDYLKKRVDPNTPSMSELFEKVLRQKGEISRLEKVDDHSFRIDDISSMALHSFVIKAQEYGRDVTFTKETVITIS